MPDDLIGSEEDVLGYYLNRMRDAVVRIAEGLPDDQLRAPGVPSGTSLLGIVWHLRGVERHWLRLVFRGEDVDVDMSMDVPPDRSTAEVVAAYRDACARSDEIVRACPDLSTLAAIPNPGEDYLCSLRRILVHLIRETSRHAGHADILRERIDGATEL
jgi:uncharacterized damage-inducible protein DinB